MKTIFKPILFLFLLITFNSCSLKEECPSCFTPPVNFYFEFVDSTTGENLITNGTYDPEQIQIINIDDESTIEYNLVTEDDLNIIKVSSIGWETEVVNYRFDLAGNELFTFRVDATRKNEDCCSYTEYNEIAVSGIDYEIVDGTNIYKIKLD
ncbi:hypothetical protein [Mangrovivirga cuniculi]|uniref:Lipoprotein n=1 Tax=Mangrovivirga cuniculi TaxID=2715131 RepID=A0A4D7K1X9_9BACT|nr:hypothetical protein [Mangrovivirga cuniculi]QCK14884.1 hypothetical protein DCC35_09090 [Mangrovivirga cuniculi]